MSLYGTSAPGVRVSRDHTPRAVATLESSAVYIAGGRSIDGALSRDPGNTNAVHTLRPGMIVGRVATSGQYAPSIIGRTSQAVLAGATTITLPAAVAIELVRRRGATGTFTLTGPPTAAGTIASEIITYNAVNTTTGAVTVTATTNAFVAGSLVRPGDGSEAPRGILAEHVRVTDVDGNDIDAAIAKLLIAGDVDSAMVVDYPADASLQAWLKTQLNAPETACGPMRFSDNF